jgi:hypothetical protein
VNEGFSGGEKKRLEMLQMHMFQPSLAAGQPATLLGYPLIEAEDMPDIAANSLSIAFGNFKAGYVIAERNATTKPPPARKTKLPMDAGMGIVRFSPVAGSNRLSDGALMSTQ